MWKNRKDFPEINQIHLAVRKAIKAGAIKKQPCEDCKSRGEVEASYAMAHHDDYSKPFEVRWLCSKHHKEWHCRNMPRPIIPEMAGWKYKDFAWLGCQQNKYSYSEIFSLTYEI
jgi:hypothetical protein